MACSSSHRPGVAGKERQAFVLEVEEGEQPELRPAGGNVVADRGEHRRSQRNLPVVRYE